MSDVMSVIVIETITSMFETVHKEIDTLYIIIYSLFLWNLILSGALFLLKNKDS